MGDELRFESKDGVRGCGCVAGKGGGGADTEEADVLAVSGKDANMCSFARLCCLVHRYVAVGMV